MKELILSKASYYDRRYSFPDGFIAAIISIESNFKVRANGDGGRAFGLMQILRGGALTEYEDRKRVKISDEEAYDIDTNLKIGCWYLGERIPEYLARYNHEYNLKNVIICYNAGIGKLNKGIIPAGTRDYFRKMDERLPGILGGQYVPKITESNFKPLLLAIIPFMLKKLFG